MKTNGKHEVMTQIARQSLVLAALLAMVLSTDSISPAQSSAASTAAPAAKAAVAPVKTSAAPAAKPAAKGESEGIRVHGHWIIEVMSPNGKVTARREFENAIQSTGMSYLASLLAGNNSPGALSILLNGANTQFPCGVNGNCALANAGTYWAINFAAAGPCGAYPNDKNTDWLVAGSGTCLISTPTSVLGGTCRLMQQQNAFPSSAPCSTSLTITAPTFTSYGTANSGVPSGAAQLSLNGSITASSPGSGYVTDVETVFETCLSNSTPANCFSAGGTNLSSVEGSGDNQLPVFPVGVDLFTMRALDGNGTDPAMVPYAVGQTISVTVTFSFQ